MQKFLLCSAARTVKRWGQWGQIRKNQNSRGLQPVWHTGGRVGAGWGQTGAYKGMKLLIHYLCFPFPLMGCPCMELAGHCGKSTPAGGSPVARPAAGLALGVFLWRWFIFLRCAGLSVCVDCCHFCAVTSERFGPHGRSPSGAIGFVTQWYAIPNRPRRSGRLLLQ